MNLRLLLGFMLIMSILNMPFARAQSPAEELYHTIALRTNVPWHVLAAADQYERTLNYAQRVTRHATAPTISIVISEDEWGSAASPGIGQDGDGDGNALRTSDGDVLYSFAKQLTVYGHQAEDVQRALWHYYENPRAVQRIHQFSMLLQKMKPDELAATAFPLPRRSDYSYRSTWGSGRSWGGARIHEGTDLFAHYGVPVRATTTGVVELLGWNNYGGWRVGIRDIDNRYHYFAHLSGFAKGLKQGNLVKAGATIGWVGSSGYGKPGTSGKFPPHLHYGIYRDYGLVDWSFDPFPFLRGVERKGAS